MIPPKKIREISHFDEQTPFLNAFINGIVGTIAGMLSGHFWLDKHARKHCPLPWSSLDTLAQEKVFQH